MSKLKGPERRLLEKIVVERSPTLIPLVEALTRETISKDEKLSLQGVISDEFTDRGLNRNDEPNQYGLELEALIDKIQNTT